ncbi:hypothetical protein Q5P01_021518 [Channa striata]|uniref:Uncharacterized protein n=1 Tax=Channa striata TaxID=64152 RepID=A0AA88LUT3_CHASR|nr:hypothetical protein Q5P01_021518 [Channa striata]
MQDNDSLIACYYGMYWKPNMRTVTEMIVSPATSAGLRNACNLFWQGRILWLRPAVEWTVPLLLKSSKGKRKIGGQAGGGKKGLGGKELCKKLNIGERVRESLCWCVCLERSGGEVTEVFEDYAKLKPFRKGGGVKGQTKTEEDAATGTKMEGLHITRGLRWLTVINDQESGPSPTPLPAVDPNHSAVTHLQCSVFFDFYFFSPLYQFLGHWSRVASSFCCRLNRLVLDDRSKIRTNSGEKHDAQPGRERRRPDRSTGLHRGDAPLDTGEPWLTALVDQFHLKSPAVNDSATVGSPINL